MLECIWSHAQSFNANNNPIGWTKMTKVLRSKTKQVADEEFIDSAEPGWLIWRADVSGWPLLFLEYLHRQNPQLALASSSYAAPSGPEYLSLAKEF